MKSTAPTPPNAPDIEYTAEDDKALDKYIKEYRTFHSLSVDHSTSDSSCLVTTTWHAVQSRFALAGMPETDTHACCSQSSLVHVP